MQVPNLETPQVEQQPLPGRAYPRFSEEVPEAAFGTPVGVGLEHLAGAGVEQEAQLKQQHDQLRTVDAITQLSAGEDAIRFGADGKGGAFSMHGVDAINMPDKFLPAYRDMAAKIAATLTPDQQRMFQGHVAIGERELHLQLSRYEFAESNRLADQTFKAGTEQAISSAALNYRDPHLIQKSILDLHALNTMQAQREGWTPVEQHQALVSSIAQMHGSVIDAYLSDSNATGARAYLQQHRDEIVEFNPKLAEQLDKNIKAGIVQQTANETLAAYQGGQEAGAQALAGIKDKGLTPVEQGQVQALVNHGLIERAESLQQDPKNQAQIRWLDEQITNRTPSPTALGTVDSLVRRGVYTFQQGEVKRDEVLRALRVGQEKQEAFAYVGDAYKNGTKLDPQSDKKAVADFFYENVPDKPGSTAYNAFAAEVMARVGVMPEPVAEYLRAQLVSGPAPEAAKVARLANTLHETNDIAYAYGTDERLRSIAYGINAAVKAGADPEGAVEHERDIGKIDKARKDQLDEDWKRQKPSGPGSSTWDQFDANVIRSSLAQDEHYTTPGTFYGRDESSVPKVPGAMIGEFNTLAKDYFYLRDGNVQQARELAMRDLKRVWGVSEVNGQRELMKYAPERLFPNLPVADIRADLGKESYRLQESEETASSGGRKWHVAEPDEFGSPVLVRADNGMPRRFELPQPSGQATREREIKEHEKRMALSAQRERENEETEHPVQEPGSGFAEP